MTGEEFAHAYLGALKEAYPKVSFSLGSDLSITGTKDSQGVKIYIDNAYRAYQADPDSIKSIFQQYLTVAAPAFAERKPIAIENIIPVIKSAEYLEGIKEISEDKSEPVRLITEKYNSQLIIAYAEDSEISLEYLNKKAFDGLHISMDSLHNIALRNLDRIIPGVTTQGGDGTYMVTTGGGYEASLILLSSVWTKEKLPVDGDWVIAVPSRDILLVTGSKNKNGIAKIKEMIAEIHKTDSYLISAELFKWDGRKFERYAD